jgi:hypothetical protein
MTSREGDDRAKAWTAVGGCEKSKEIVFCSPVVESRISCKERVEEEAD